MSGFVAPTITNRAAKVGIGCQHHVSTKAKTRQINAHVQICVPPLPTTATTHQYGDQKRVSGKPQDEKLEIGKNISVEVLVR